MVRWEDGGLLRTDGNFHLLVFDPRVELLTSLFGLGSEATRAEFEVSWAFREAVFDREETLDDDEDSPACFGCHRWQGFYVASCNRPRAHAYA